MKNNFYNYYKFYKNYIYNQYNRYKGYIRRRSRRYFAWVSLAGMVLNLLLPFAGLVKPVGANGFIHPTAGGEALFENTNPDFKVEFGDRKDPAQHRIRFEAAPENNSYNDYAPPGAAQRLKESLLGAESKGIELKLLPATPAEEGYNSYNDYKGYNQPPATPAAEPAEGRLEEINKGLEETKSRLEKIEEKIKGVSKQVEDIVTGTKDILEEAGVGKPELTTRPQMDTNPADFARTAGVGVPPSELAPPVDTVSQTVTEDTKVEYQVLPGKGVKESITILDYKDYKNYNSYTFELTLDPGVRVRQSIDGLADNGYNSYNGYNNYGTIYFVDRFGRYLFNFETPFMVDAAGARSSAVELKLDGYNDYKNYNNYSEPQILRLTVTADSQWLSAADRVYPVLIDPTIVHEQSPAFLSGTENRTQTTNSPAVQLTYPEIQPDEHTVGLWHFNSDNPNEQKIVDSSGLGNHAYRGEANSSATAASDPAWTTQGNVGATAYNAMEFDGADDYAEIGVGAIGNDINGAKAVTIESWVNLDTLPGATARERIFNVFVATGSTGAALSIYDTAGQVEVGGRSVSTDGFQSVKVNFGKTGEWHHLAGVLDYEHDLIYVYIDGVQKAATAVTFGNTSYTQGTPVGDEDTIGALADVSGDYIDAKIDEVAIHNRALTPEEIAAHASKSPYGVHTSPVIDFGSTPNTLDSLTYSAEGVATGDGETPYNSDGLVAQWNFNETSGTTAYNTAGPGSCGGTASNCNGTVTNMTTTSQDAAAGDGWTANNALWPKSSPSALMFDGTDGRVSVADNANLDGTSEITVSAWVKLDKSSATQSVVAKYGNAAADQAYNLQVTSSNTVRFITGTSANVTSTSVTTINDGNWHHLVGTYNRTTTEQRIFIDGVEEDKDTQTGALRNSAVALNVGADLSGVSNAAANFLDGTIDAVSVYSREFKGSEVLSNYQSGLIEFQTRTGATADPNDGTWEAWKSTSGTGDTQIAAMDADSANWSADSSNPASGGITKSDDSTTKLEGTGSMKLTTGAPQVDANTVALWHMEETSGTGAYIKDATANANHGTPTGTTVVDGFYGKARSFDGTDDYIQVGDTNLPTGAGTRTVEFWTKRSSSGNFTVGDYPFFYGTKTQYQGFGLYGVDGTTDINFYGHSYDFDTGINLDDTNWHFLSLTFDGTNLRAYKDGVLISTTDRSLLNTVLSTFDFTIGGFQVANQYWGGIIDEVKVSNVARSAEEIAEAYRAGRDHRINKTISSQDLSSKSKVPFWVASDRPGTFMEATVGESAYANYLPDANTVGLWHLEEQTGSGAYIKDSSGSGNNGTPTGTTFVQGKLGKARSFNGTSDYIDVGTGASLNLGTGDFTVEGWITFNSFINGGAYASGGIGGTGTSAGWQLGIDWNYVSFSINNAVTRGPIPHGLSTGTWYHLAATRTGSSAKIYLNGVDITSLVGDMSGNTNSGQSTKIGYIYTNYHNGMIDAVRISNTARTADEIRQAYEIGRRTHPITIDFKADLDSSNLIANTSDLSFDINPDIDVDSAPLALNLGDKIIVRENVAGTEYIAQGTVDSITYAKDVSNPNLAPQDATNANATAVTVQAWDSGSTAPSGGFTTNATVFKWQREYMDIQSLVTSHRDAVTNLTLRVTDASQGATVWLDDFESADYSGGPITAAGGDSLAIGSTANRYFQYRAILTVPAISAILAISPTLTGVKINYNSGTVPQTISADDTGRAPDANTLAYYNFDEGNVDTCSGGVNDACDSSRNGKDLAGTSLVAGSWTSANAKIGAYAITLDGTADYLSDAYDAHFNPGTNAFTVEAWFRHDTISAADYLISRYSTAAGTPGGWKIYMDASGDMCFGVDDDATWGPDASACTGGIDYDDNEWHHLAAVETSTASRTLYIDGISVATDTTSVPGTLSGTSPVLYIGSDSPTAGSYWAGEIDDVHISNKARSADEIKQNATPPPAGGNFGDGNLYRLDDTGSDDSPTLELAYKELPADEHTVGLWHFNEGVDNTCSGGEDACDSSGNGRNGTFSGATWNTAANSKLGNSSVLFSTNTDQVTVADNSLLDLTGSITLEAWIYPTTVDATERAIMVKGRNAGDQENYNLSHTTSGKLKFEYGSPTSTWHGYQSTNAELVANSWQHVAFTYTFGTASSAHLYVDGEEVTSSWTAGTGNAAAVNNNDSLYVGRLGSGTANSFVGRIDEVRISNIARTPEEIKASAQRHPYGVYTSEVMNLGADVSSIDNLRWTEDGVQTGDGETPYSTEGLVAAWNFNETSGTVAANSAGEGSCGGTASSCNGTLTNFASTASQDQAAGTGWTANNRRWGAGALMFDGSNDYVSVQNPSVLDAYPMTIEAWLKVTNVAAHGTVYGEADNTVNDKLSRLYVATDAKVYLSNENGASTLVFNSNKTVDDGEWHHILYVGAASNDHKIYIDGQEDASSTTSFTPATYNSGAIGRLPRLSPIQYFNGVADTVRLYSRALPAAEILANYQAGNIEVQTRTGTTSTPNDGSWEAWKPAGAEGAEVQLDSVDSLSPVEKISQKDLVAYWKLDETSGTRADSKGSNTLTDNATVTYAPGRLNNAASFERANGEYLSIIDNTDLSNSNDSSYTVALWYKPESNNVDGGLASKWDSFGVLDEEWILNQESDGTIRFRVTNTSDSSSTATSTATVKNDEWHLIIGWYDTDDNKAHLELNRVQYDAGSAVTNLRDDTNPLHIGLYAGTGQGRYIDGMIDEVAIWKRTLTDEERRILYEEGLDLHGAGSGRVYRSRDTTTKIEGTASEKLQIGAPQVDANTVGLWHMEETSGTGAYIKDATANANHGTPTGTTVVDGFYGKARSFNGTSDYVSLGTTGFPTGSSSRTVSLWIKTDPSIGDEGRVFSYGTFVDLQGFNILASSTRADCGSSNYLCFGAEGPGNFVSSTANILDNKWHFLSFTYNGTTLKIYVDGLEKGSGNIALNTGSTAAKIGDHFQAAGQTRFKGSIDEFMVSNTVRTADEIAEAYRAGRDHRLNKTITAADLSSKTKVPFYVAADRPGTYLEATIGESAYANYLPDANTVGLWHLEEQTGSGAYIKDSSGLGNHGTPTGSTFVQGKIGKARSFNGSTTDKIAISNNIAGHTDYTQEAWFYAPTFSSGTQSALIQVDDGAIEIFPNNCVGVWSVNNRQGVVGGQPLRRNTCAGTYIPNSWNYVAVVAQSTTTLNTYINGVLVGTSHSQDVPSGTDTEDRIGSGYVAVITIKVDEVRISNIARTAAEIRQAYEVGRRTHPITIDFSTSPTATCNSCTTIDVTKPANASKLSDVIVPGDEIIARENVAGTEYTAQATVTVVDDGANQITIDAAFSSQPSGGFTTNASLFKWQREFMDISNLSNLGFLDAAARLTIRVTNGAEGRTVWLDDFRAAGPYLSVSQTRTSSITSTPQQYFQYRMIFSTTDTAVSPTLTSISVQYHSDPQKVLGADTFRGPSAPGREDGTVDKDGNQHLGDSNVNDVYFYDRTKDQFSYALEMDGTNDYVDIGTGPTSVKTIEFWVYPQTTTEYFINTTSTTTYIWANAGTVTATGFTSPTIYVNGAVSSTIVANQWQHIAVTSATAVNASNFDIGRTADLNYLQGKIDEVVLFSDVRTAAEVATDYNARRLSDSEAGLVAIYHFDEGSGTRSYDSAQQNHGTLTNMTDDDWVNSLSDKDQSPLSQQVLGVDPNWHAGAARRSHALNFAGSNAGDTIDEDHVDAGNITAINGASTLTVEAWVKFNRVDNQPYIATKYTTPTAQGFILGHFTTSGVKAYIMNGAWDNGQTDSSLAANQWYHIAMVYDGGQSGNSNRLKIFIDGVQQTLSFGASTIPATIGTTTAPVRISESNDGAYDNMMDEVRISSTARYTSNFTPSHRLKEDANTILLYHLDEGEDNTCSATQDACDSSSNANNGTNTNMESTDWVTDSRAVMDNNARYVALGTSSAVNMDRGMEIKITSTTAFQYRWQGDQTWTTPATSTLSSYSFTSPAQIDSTGVYVGFDTTNGVFGDESFFTIPSWAIEAFSAGDAPRGGRNAFPEQAYLVATDSTVEVLDARDNTLWMRFNQSGADTGRALGADDNNNPSSVFMKHGQLLVGTNGTSATGLYRVDFNRDKIYRYNATDRRVSGEPIAKRNAGDHTYGSADTAFALVDSTVNDVHANVSEGKLYIATATDTGLDVIQASQTNTYSYSDVAGDDYNAVWLTSGGELYALNETQAQAEKWNNVDDDAADELAGTPNKLWDQASTPAMAASTPTIQAGAPSALSVTEGTSVVDGTSDSIYVGSDQGSAVIHDKAGDETNGSVKYYTKDYVTEDLIGNVSGYWPLNETSTGAAAVTRTDQSVGTNNLTDNNTVTSVSGVRGNGIDLEVDTTEYLSIADNASLSTGDVSFTVAAWVQLESKPAARMFAVGKYQAGVTFEYELLWNNSNDRFEFGSGNTGTHAIANNLGAPSTGQWYFLVGWHDSVANTVNIQVNNGTVDSIAEPGVGADGGGAFEIGSRGGENWDGIIDEVLFTKEVLTAAQRTALYVSGLEALNNKNRSQLTASQKDLLSELAGDTNTVKAVAVAKANQTGVTRADQIFVGTNGTAADDGRLSQFIATGDIRNHTFDETSTDPYILTDNDISSLSVSSDGAYIIVGTDDAGITIIHEGSVVGRMRGGKKTQSGLKRPHN